jgi:hypothetical protein
MIALYPNATDQQRIEHFNKVDVMPAVRNAELVELDLEDNAWRVRFACRQGIPAESSQTK